MKNEMANLLLFFFGGAVVFLSSVWKIVGMTRIFIILRYVTLIKCLRLSAGVIVFHNLIVGAETILRKAGHKDIT